MNARFSYTRLLDGYVIPVPGAEKDPFKGEVGNAKNRWNATLGFATTSSLGTSPAPSSANRLRTINTSTASMPRANFDIGAPITKEDIAISANSTSTRS